MPGGALPVYGCAPWGFRASRVQLLNGFPENIVGLVLDDFLRAFFSRAAFTGRGDTAFDRHTLDVAQAAHGASTHGRVGFDQLESQVARAGRRDSDLGAGDFGAVQGFPGGGWAVVVADLFAAAIVQRSFRTDKHPFSHAGRAGFVAALVCEFANAD